MIKVGITGGIASGKTTVCQIFELLGVPVYYADTRAIWLIENDAEVKAAIEAVFGKNAYNNNAYDRKYIANIVFNNPDMLALLNKVVHPAVGSDFQDWASRQTSEIVMHEAALLIEAGLHHQMDKMVVVTAPLNLRIQRIVNRDKITKSDAHKRIKAQMPQSRKVGYADYIIRNNEKRLLVPQVWEVYKKLKQLTLG